MAPAGAQACPRKQRPQTAVGAVEAISQDAPDAVGRLLLECRALKHVIGPGQGRCTSLLSVSSMPEHAATDNRREIHPIGEAMSMLLIREEIDGQWQTTPGQH